MVPEVEGRNGIVTIKINKPWFILNFSVDDAIIFRMKLNEAIKKAKE